MKLQSVTHTHTHTRKLISIMLVLGSIFTFAQTTQLATWDFANANTTPTLASGIGSATIATSGNIQLSSSFTNSYSVTNLSATTLAQANNGNGTIPAQYISVTISPNPNFAIDISSVAIQGFSQNRNRTFNLSYIDAQSNLINVQNKTIATPSQAQTFTVSSLTGIQTPIELRFYIFSNPADVYEAAGFGEATGLDLVINGKITNTTTNPILPGMWSLQGNTVAGSQFLGSVNNEALKIVTNNTEKVRIDSDGNVGIGTTAPTQKLSVAGNINLTGTGTGLIFDDGTFINSASKINQAVVNGQTTNVSLSGLALQNLTFSGNRINYTGSALEFYTPVQGQYNGGKPVLSMSQYGEINFYSSPYLNDNAMYFGNTGNFNNGIRKANDFGGVGGYSGPVVFGENGGALGSSTANSNWNTTGTKLALSWDANQNVKIHKALQFADGSVQTTAGIGSITQPVTYNNTSNYYTYQGNVNIPGTLKLGTNSLYLSGSNAGSSNEIYSDGSALKIQSNPAFNFNTIINTGNTGNVGIGVSAPETKLHVAGGVRINGSSTIDGQLFVRDRIDIGRDDNNPLIRIGSLVMQDFSRFSYSINGQYPNPTTFIVETTPESFVFGNIFFDEISQTYKSIFNGDNSTSFSGYPNFTTTYAAKTNGGTALRFDSENGNLEFISIPKVQPQQGQGGGTLDPTGFSLTKEQLLNQRRLMISDAGVTVNGNNFIVGEGNGLVFVDGTKISSLNEILALYPWVINGNSISYGGNVGIGTTGTLTEKLEVNGNVKITGNNVLEFGAGLTKEQSAGKIGYGTFDASALCIVGAGTQATNRKIHFWNEGGAIFEGNVGIGTDKLFGYKLSVEGKIRAREVDVNNLAWSDYVFDKTYKLPKLEEVEKYINKNGHLEHIPNAKTVAEKGYGLSEMDAMLLRKIEELTLYILEQDKRIQAMEAKK